MARTEKRYLNNVQLRNIQIPVFKTGLYVRLSVDHDDKKSDSIETQTEMLKEFVRKYNERSDKDSELVIYDIYSDLGKTGTNFDRPGFERLMNDIRQGKINCIMVKDFSRFGRNYIETGDYLEKILPFMGVRFISVCDNYDSFAEKSKNQELSVNIKNLINDAYAKDISAKGRAAKRIAQKRGDYVGATAPYGYLCIKENGVRKLVIDPDAAQIVQCIFYSYVNGIAIQHIINKLFEDGVHRISDYNRYHHVYCQEGESLCEWGNSSIRTILTRNLYYGDMVQHKYESRFYKGEKWCDILDEDQWIVVPGTHEPIISREIFEKAQVRLQLSKKQRKSISGWDNSTRAFYNVFFCGDCKRRMTTFEKRGSVHYFCRARSYKDSRKCYTHGISENKLQAIVRSELSKQLEVLGVKKKNLAIVAKKVYQEKIENIHDEIRKIDLDIRHVSDKIANIFLEYKEGRIPQKEYLSLKKTYLECKNFYEDRKMTLEQKIKDLYKSQCEETAYLGSLLKVSETTRLTPELVEALIDRIYLYSDGHLEICFKFKGEVNCG